MTPYARVNFRNAHHILKKGWEWLCRSLLSKIPGSVVLFPFLVQLNYWTIKPACIFWSIKCVAVEGSHIGSRIRVSEACTSFSPLFVPWSTLQIDSFRMMTYITLAVAHTHQPIPKYINYSYFVAFSGLGTQKQVPGILC